MKKIIAITISLVFVLSAFLPFANVSAADDLMAWYDLQPEGAIVYTPNFNGDAGIYEPGYLNGDPIVTVDPVDSNKMTIITGTNKSKSYWGGFIETLPLNEYTCYTIYVSVTRSAKAAVGIYCDSIYGIYGYQTHTKLMNQGSSLTGHDYLYYETLGVDVNTSQEMETTHDFAIEVNGVDTTLAYYIKNNAGEYVLMDQSQDGEIAFFNADVLGLFFYVYYTDQVSTISNCYITKGLTWGNVVYPERTEAPETTPAPETTKAPETEAPKVDETEAPKVDETEAPAAEGDATQAPVVTQAPTTTGEAKKGCGGFVAGGIAIVALLGTAVVIKKRD